MAAKVIDKSRITRSVQREKVDLEIELFSEASGHPNIVTYMDTFEDENCIVILQELCNKKVKTSLKKIKKTNFDNIFFIGTNCFLFLELGSVSAPKAVFERNRSLRNHTSNYFRFEAFARQRYHTPRLEARKHSSH